MNIYIYNVYRKNQSYQHFYVGSFSLSTLSSCYFQETLFFFADVIFHVPISFSYDMRGSYLIHLTLPFLRVFPDHHITFYFPKNLILKKDQI